MSIDKDPSPPTEACTPPDGAGVAKKRYASPNLIEYGSIAKMTAEGGSSAADGPVGFMMN